MPRHHIGLITGLGSSVPGLGAIWTKWARSLQRRLKKHYKGRNDVVTHRVSSDGNGEKQFFDAVLTDAHAGNLGVVTGAGHSNGSRDWLFGAKMLYPGTEIPYLGLIDMTLGEYGAEAYGNIKVLDEFHGVLETVDFHPSFAANGGVHNYMETGLGHTASANAKSVQDQIFNRITAII